MTHRMRRPSREGGATAVEFAIVLPLLVVLIAGIVDLGRLLYAEIIISNAAREGARMVAMGYPSTDADARVAAASPNVDLFGGLGTPAIVVCPPNPSPTTAASYTARVAGFEWLLLDAFMVLPTPAPEATATMRCNG